MQGWHAHRLLGNDMYGDHILKVNNIPPFIGMHHQVSYYFGLFMQIYLYFYRTKIQYPFQVVIRI